MISYNLDVIDVSAAFFYCAKHYPSSKPITHKKLQNLMYYAQGFSILHNGKKIFDDGFEIVGYGVICRRLYDVYKGISYNRITDKMVKGDCKNVIRNVDVFNVLCNVWKAFRNLTGSQLEIMVHRDFPFANAVKNNHSTISDNDMMTFFNKELMKC